MSDDPRTENLPESGSTNASALLEMEMPLGIFAGDLFRRATEYVDTLRVLIAHESAPLRPAGFLFAHALELSLKSFLAAKGVARRELERGLGHDLTRLLERAEKLGLPPVYMLPPFVRHMHEMNSDFDLRYPTGYNLHIPKPKDCVPIADAVLAAIAPTVQQADISAQLDFASDTQSLRGHKITFAKVRKNATPA